MHFSCQELETLVISRQIMRKLLPPLLLLLIIAACEQGLQPVTGFEGTVTLPTDNSGNIQWPDSLDGAVVVFAKYSLNISAETLPSLLLGYSQPLDLEQKHQSYFLQARPNEFYIVGVVATTVPVSQILTLPMDSLAVHPDYFKIVGFYQSPDQPDMLGFVHFGDGEIQEGINIDVNPNLILPF